MEKEYANFVECFLLCAFQICIENCWGKAKAILQNRFFSIRLKFFDAVRKRVFNANPWLVFHIFFYRVFALLLVLIYSHWLGGNQTFHWAFLQSAFTDFHRCKLSPFMSCK